MNISRDEGNSILFYIFAAFLTASLLINIYPHFVSKRIWNLLWYCNFSSCLCIVGLIFQNKIILNSVLINSILPQIPWFYNFISGLFGEKSGRTAWLWNSDSIFPLLNSVFLHILIIPASFYGTVRLGYENISLYFALFWGNALLILIYLITPIYDNVNCVFFPCDLNFLVNKKSLETDWLYLTPLYLFLQLFFWSAAVISTHFFVSRSLNGKNNSF